MSVGNDPESALCELLKLRRVVGDGRQARQVAQHLGLALVDREYRRARLEDRPEEDNRSGRVIALTGADRLDVCLERQNASGLDPGSQLSIPTAGLERACSDLPRRGHAAAHQDHAVLPASAYRLVRGTAEEPCGPVVPLDDKPGRVDDDQPRFQLPEQPKIFSYQGSITSMRIRRAREARPGRILAPGGGPLLQRIRPRPG